MADFGKPGRQTHNPSSLTALRDMSPAWTAAVSEHMGQGKAMPHQGIVQSAARNAEKSAVDQAELQAAKSDKLPKEIADSSPSTDFKSIDVKKLTKAQRSDLVDQVLKV